jgi:hypothetical protein
MAISQCCGSGSKFSIPGLGSKKYRIQDPEPHQRIQVFLTQKIVSKLWEI